MENRIIIASVNAALLAVATDDAALSAQILEAGLPEGHDEVIIERGLTLFADSISAEEAGYTDIRWTGDIEHGGQLYGTAARRAN